jgi:hypothetical protein
MLCFNKKQINTVFFNIKNTANTIILHFLKKNKKSIKILNNRQNTKNID